MSNSFKTFVFYDSSSRNFKYIPILTKLYKRYIRAFCKVTTASVLGPKISRWWLGAQNGIDCPWTVIVKPLRLLARNFESGLNHRRWILPRPSSILGMNNAYLIRSSTLSSTSIAMSTLDSSELEVLKLY